MRIFTIIVLFIIPEQVREGEKRGKGRYKSIHKEGNDQIYLQILSMGNTIQELQKKEGDEMAKYTHKTKNTKNYQLTIVMITFMFFKSFSISV